MTNNKYSHKIEFSDLQRFCGINFNQTYRVLKYLQKIGIQTILDDKLNAPSQLPMDELAKLVQDSIPINF